MKISLNWLKRYVDINVDVKSLSDIFTSLGFEVENVESIGLMKQSTLVVGEIQEISQHPNADKLSVCKVCVNVNDVRQIVCGAKNFKLFDHVPVALPGTILPENVQINESNLRGVQSCGMMCSSRELGLGNDHAGLLILDKSTRVGTILHDAIDISSDTIFDLSITSNRGDCLGYFGIAREIGCKLCLPTKFPKEDKPTIKSQKSLMDKITVISDDCSCYYAFCINGVKIQKSPDWLVKDLQTSGIKSINNVVDICNWVMLESGNPLHAFDIKKVKNRILNVRYAANGESLLGLDNKVHDLNDMMTVIADSECPLVIAGIVGSIDAEIDDSTTDVLIESACFDHAAIMKTSRFLGVLTDSSYRFSRSVDGALCEYSGIRATKLILDLCGGEYVQNIVAKKYENHAKVINISGGFIAQKLGFQIEHSEILRILTALNFEVKGLGTELIITVPSFRSDIERPIDIVEECLRVYGTENLPNKAVILDSVHRVDHRAYTFYTQVRQILANHGFFECYNYSLLDSKVVTALFGEDHLIGLKNPLLSDQDCFRPSLLPGLLATLKFNIQNGNYDGSFFEIGKVAVQINNERNECLAVSFIAPESPFDRQLKSCKVDFLDVKKLCLDVLNSLTNPKQIDLQPILESKIWQPEYAAEYLSLARSGIEIKCGLLNKCSLKSHFDIKSNIWGAEIILSDSVFTRKGLNKVYKPFSQFPRISKDISIIVNRDEKVGKVKHILEKIAKKSVANTVKIEYITLFDIYAGDRIDNTKKAFGFEINFRSDERTLTDNEVQKSFEYIQNEISKIYEIRKIS